MSKIQAGSFYYLNGVAVEIKSVSDAKKGNIKLIDGTDLKGVTPEEVFTADEVAEKAEAERFAGLSPEEQEKEIQVKAAYDAEQKRIADEKLAEEQKLKDEEAARIEKERFDALSPEEQEKEIADKIAAEYKAKYEAMTPEEREAEDKRVAFENEPKTRRESEYTSLLNLNKELEQKVADLMADKAEVENKLRAATPLKEVAVTVDVPVYDDEV